MERCSNCGAATRPGAKFCTSCGTRLNLDQGSTSPADSAWNNASSSQETQSATPAAGDESAPKEAEPVTPEPHWEQALQDPRREDEDQPADSPWPSVETSPQAEADTWEAVARDRSDWSSKWSSGETADEETAETGSDANVTFSDYERPSWDTRSEETAGSEDDSVRFTASSPEQETSATANGGATVPSWTSSFDRETDAVVHESETIVPEFGTTGATEDNCPGDGISVDDRDSRVTPEPDNEREPREQANTLLEELRALIWKIGEDEPSGTSDTATIINNMRRVRGETGDFSDLREVIEVVRENPRDIDALRDLGLQADRLQALLDSHARLTSALDDAIRDLR